MKPVTSKNTWLAFLLMASGLVACNEQTSDKQADDKPASSRHALSAHKAQLDKAKALELQIMQNDHHRQALQSATDGATDDTTNQQVP